MAHTGQKEESYRANYTGNRAKAHKFSRGRGKDRTITNTGNRPTCQLYGKYGHSVSTCWHRFDENFMPQDSTGAQPEPANKAAQNQSHTTQPAQNSKAMAMMATTQEYSLPSDLESQA